MKTSSPAASIPVKHRTPALRLTALAPLLLVLSGCAASDLQVQAATASGIAVVANVSLDQLATVYQDDLVAAMRQAAIEEDASAAAQHRPSDRRPGIEAAEEAVNARWILIWGDATSVGAWETFRALHDGWANQIEAGQAKVALGPRVNAAYCDLLVALPPKYRAAIAIPPISCPVLPTKETP